MRGVPTPITFLRREVFKNVADAAYEDWDLEAIKTIPHLIIPGDIPKYRDSVDREREIVRARVRLAMNMPMGNRFDENFTEDFDLNTLGNNQVGLDLLSVIPHACEACEEKSYFVTNSCHGCLAQPCVSVCPVKATSIKNGQSFIDQEACIKCGKCYDVCPYGSIVKNERPCNAACGVNAITKDEEDRAVIVAEKCVGCGMCMVSCPFGAIMDRSEIYQVIDGFKKNTQISAIIAPAFVGQFGDKVKPEQVIEGLFLLGFTDVKEVAYGADVTAVDEAKHYLKHVPVDQPFLATSCCPAWLKMAKSELKEKAYCVSESTSPMIETATAIKKKYPETKIVMVGPCSAKKLEAAHYDTTKSVDYVLTFEEVNAMFHSRKIILEDLIVTHDFGDASVDGRAFAMSGGVAVAVENVIKRLDPDRVVKMEKAENLSNCKKMVLLAKAGKRDGYLLEGMACPGGCVGGAGTIVHQNKSSVQVTNYARSSTKSTALKTVEEIKIASL
jgi:[FeFe] hydrogenase (group B1/B3)